MAGAAPNAGLRRWLALLFVFSAALLALQAVTVLRRWDPLRGG